MLTPEHLAIIIDGNRRWAKKRGLPSFYGHKKGLDNVKKIANYCFKKGVKILTLYVFSTENWQRSKTEVAYLIRLLGSAFSQANIKELNEKEIKLNIIGQKERLSKQLQEKIDNSLKATESNKKGILNLAISYGGQAEIIQAIKNIIKKKLKESEITEKVIDENLWTAGLPYPDLIIRTGGDWRLSNFLLWQSAYSELYFENKTWPDFNEKDIDKIFLDYSQRSRRFGK